MNFDLSSVYKFWYVYGLIVAAIVGTFTVLGYRFLTRPEAEKTYAKVQVFDDQQKKLDDINQSLADLKAANETMSGFLKGLLTAQGKSADAINSLTSTVNSTPKTRTVVVASSAPGARTTAIASSAPGTRAYPAVTPPAQTKVVVSRVYDIVKPLPPDVIGFIEGPIKPTPHMGQPFFAWEHAPAVKKPTLPGTLLPLEPHHYGGCLVPPE